MSRAAVQGAISSPVESNISVREQAVDHAERVTLASTALVPPAQGLCIVMLGPDGTGKSTMRAHLLRELAPLFRQTRSYHFRPRVIGRIGPGRPIKQPHSMKARGKIASVLYLFTIFADYWLGYLLHIRSLLANSSLVVLDRYFHDILIDPVRYRYGGPMWLVRGLQFLVPPRDVLFLVLDADEKIIFARKRELAFEELARQRKAYVAWARQQPNSLVVRTDRSIEQSAADAVRAIVDYINLQRIRQNLAAKVGN
jgi:thymidylate kinase